MHKFHPELIKVKPCNHMNMCVTNTTNNDMLITSIFRSFNDVGYFYFSTEDTNNHNYLSYKRISEYENVILSFDLDINDKILSWNDTNIIQCMLVEMFDNKRIFSVPLGFLGIQSEKIYEEFLFEEEFYLSNHYIVWDSEQITIDRKLAIKNVDYKIDYVTGKITRIDSSEFPKDSVMNIYYKYHSNKSYEIDFNNLWYTSNPRLSDEKFKVPTYEIKAVYFPVRPNNYNKEKNLFTGLFKTGILSFTNYKVKGGELLLNDNPNQDIILNHIIRENYDEIYYLNPKKIVKGLFNLGFKNKEIMLYIGSKKHFNYYGALDSYNNTPETYMIEFSKDSPLNNCFIIWLNSFFKTANELGYKNVIISFSPKLSLYPYNWLQLDEDENSYDDNKSYPLSFCNEEVISYYKKLVTEIMDITIGYRTLTKICIEDLQYYNNDNKITIYDEVTSFNYLAEFGNKIPKVNNDTNIDNNDISIINLKLWLQNNIKNFINEISSIIKVPKYLNSNIGIYIHVEKALDDSYNSFMKGINFNASIMKKDFIIFDDKLWLNNGNTNNHNKVFKFGSDALGLNPYECYYTINNTNENTYINEFQKAYDSEYIDNFIISSGEYLRKNNLNIRNITLKEEPIIENPRNPSRWDDKVEEYFIRNMIFFGNNIFIHVKIRQLSFYTDELKEFKENNNGEITENIPLLPNNPNIS